MSASTYQLIGRIIAAPRTSHHTIVTQRSTVATCEPLPVLIGRILGPPAAVRADAPALAA